MANFYRTSDGDILPFHQIIRVMNNNGRIVVLFVNGGIDVGNDGKEFLTAYEEWLEKCVDNQKLFLYDYSTKQFEGV